MWLPKGLQIRKGVAGEWVVGAWGFPHMTVKEMKASGYFQPIASSLRPKGEGNPLTLSVLFFFELCVGASSGATVVIGATTALEVVRKFLAIDKFRSAGRKATAAQTVPVSVDACGKKIATWDGSVADSV